MAYKAPTQAEVDELYRSCGMSIPDKYSLQLPTYFPELHCTHPKQLTENRLREIIREELAR